MRNRLTMVLFLAGAFFAAAAEAAPITFNFTGVATGSWPGGIATPAPLTGFYTFEYPTPDASVNPFRGSYAAITAYSISVGGYVATGSAGTITIENDFFGIDYYFVDLPVTALLGGFAPLGTFKFTFGDTSQTAFNSDALPTAIDLSAFGSVRAFQVQYLPSCAGVDDCHAAGIFGYIDSLTVATSPAAVPEPGTFLLMGTGIALVMARRRRQR